MKIVIVLFLLAVLAALASAGVFMLRKGRDGDPRGAHDGPRAGLRVGLSVALFLLRAVQLLDGLDPAHRHAVGADRARKQETPRSGVSARRGGAQSQ